MPFRVESAFDDILLDKANHSKLTDLDGSDRLIFDIFLRLIVEAVPESAEFLVKYLNECVTI
jgi:hypothetical protein